MTHARDMATQQKRSRFVQRLGYYLLGVAIGMIVLGIAWSGRRAAQEAQQAANSPIQDR